MKCLTNVNLERADLDLRPTVEQTHCLVSVPYASRRGARVDVFKFAISGGPVSTIGEGEVG